MQRKKTKIKYGIFPFIFVLCISFAWIYTAGTIPGTCFIREGEDVKLQTLCPITLSQTDTDKAVRVNLYGIIPVKTVNVTVIKEKQLIPGGQPLGIKMYCAGLEVISISKVDTSSPASDAGIRAGDLITQINGADPGTAENFTDILEKNGKEPLKLRYNRDGTEKTVTVIPQYDEKDKSYKIGLWVRDSAAGIGTLTYYDPTDNAFGALGHSVSDTDTSKLLPLRSGTVVSTVITDVKKSTSGEPGQLSGTFLDETVGTLYKNTDCGIFGTLTAPLDYTSQPIDVGLSGEVHKGAAKIRCTLDGNGVKEYSVEITDIDSTAEKSNKNMIIRITDDELLTKTGGIVQGMSGSPLIQDGKLIGAVTHVLVSDPKEGYAVFIENMLSSAK